MEGSFADAANNHGSKRARWRGLWRQRIQSCLIAAVQNLRILLKKAVGGPSQESIEMLAGSATERRMPFEMERAALILGRRSLFCGLLS